MDVSCGGIGREGGWSLNVLSEKSGDSLAIWWLYINVNTNYTAVTRGSSKSVVAQIRVIEANGWHVVLNNEMKAYGISIHQ